MQPQEPEAGCRRPNGCHPISWCPGGRHL